MSLHIIDAPPAYTGASRDRFFQGQARRTTPPSLDGTRHPIQGGSVSSRAASSSYPPRFQINLNQRNHYKSGDTVSGTLDLISEHSSGQNVGVGSISISFSGRCTTTRPSRPNQACRNSLQLFSMKIVLFTGPATLYAAPAGMCPSFPFQFTFPSHCDLSEAAGFETGPFFNTRSHQHLPASFTDASYADKAAIVYELKAELLAQGFRGYYSHGSFSQTCALNMYAPRTTEEPTVKFTPFERFFTHQSLDLLQPEERKYHERPLTLSQKLGIRSVSTARQPKAAFKATLLMPSTAIIGQPLPLMLHVEHDVERSSLVQPPVIHLTKIQVFLRSETSICSMEHQSVRGGPDQTGWTTSSQIAGIGFSKRLVRVEHLDLRNVMNLTLDRKLHPSFKTFNVARTYSLRAAGTIKCAGKSFALWTELTRCTFLAEDYELRLPGYNDPPLTIGGEDQPVDEGPPPYANYVPLDVPLHQSIAFGRDQRHPSMSSSYRHHSGSSAAAAALIASAASADSGAAASAASASSSSGGGGGGGGGC